MEAITEQAPIKILVVDDDPTVHLLLIAALEDCSFPYDLTQFETGSEAFEHYDEHRDVDIIVSDWMMPKMSGIDLLKKIREIDKKESVYFLLLTGLQCMESLVEGLNAGANGFIRKPFSCDEIIAWINVGCRVISMQRQISHQNQIIKSSLDQFNEDLNSAAKLNSSLMPEPTQIDNASFAAYFRPSKVLGGDVYGFRKLDDDIVSFYQIDVSGHGIASALYSFSVSYDLARTGVHEDLLLDFDADGNATVVAPDVAVSRLNKRFIGDADNCMYFTMAYGLLNTKTGEAQLCQAGHPPIIWQRTHKGVCELMGDGGFPVGMLDIAEYDSFSIQLEPGDRLYIYSDGYVEASSPCNEPFSEERLCSLINDHGKVSIDSIVANLPSSIESWTGKIDQDDDITMLGVEWTAEKQ